MRLHANLRLRCNTTLYHLFPKILFKNPNKFFFLDSGEKARISRTPRVRQRRVFLPLTEKNNIQLLATKKEKEKENKFK